jgi:uncharacterized YkwD family protein
MLQPAPCLHREAAGAHLHRRPRHPAPAPAPPAPAPTPPSPAFSLKAEEARMLDLVNQERAKAGVPALQAHQKLTEVARLKSADMVKLNYFAHQSPTYGSPFDMMRSFGISYTMAGENLAMAASVDRAHTALMNSSGHRANILNANYTHIRHRHGPGQQEPVLYPDVHPGKIEITFTLHQREAKKGYDKPYPFFYFSFKKK